MEEERKILLDGILEEAYKMIEEKTWSLSALFELIPHNNFYGVELNNYGDGKVWTAMFQWKSWDQHPIRISDSPLDAVFEIICWLLENGYIKKRGKE